MRPQKSQNRGKGDFLSRPRGLGVCLIVLVWSLVTQGSWAVDGVQCGPYYVTISIGVPGVPSAPPKQPPSSQVRSLGTPPASQKSTDQNFREVFASLARQGKLLHQSDFRLAQRGLLVPEGGLCATTCAVNVLHGAFRALGESTSVFEAHSDYALHQLVANAMNRGTDARNGIYFHQLAPVLNEVANTYSNRLGVHAELNHRWRTRNGVDFSQIEGGPNQLVLLSVSWTKESSHAIVVLGVDTRSRRITFSDPNHPNEIRSASYTHNPKTAELRIEGLVGNGRVHDVLHVNIHPYNKGASDRWKAFEGKRVWMTDNEGYRHLTSIHRVEGPTPEFPEGRVIQYSVLFGGGGGGTWEAGDISHIEEARPREARLFQEYVGKKVRIRFEDEGFARQYGEFQYEVKGLSAETDRDSYPFGGIEVEFKTSPTSIPRDGVVPFEVIESIEVVKEP